MNHISALLSPRRLTLAILLALAASLTTHAQTIEMSPTDGPYGGTVVDVLLDRDGSLFAATAVGLFRSTDGGTTWEMNAFEGIDVRYLRRDSVGFVYAVTDSGLYRSGDGGARWSRTLTEYENVDDIAFHPNGTHFFIDNDGGELYRSTDAGGSWTLAYSSHWLFSSVITAAGDSTLYLNDMSGLMKSTDNGTTWCALVTKNFFTGDDEEPAFGEDENLVDALIAVGDGDTVLAAIADSTRLRGSCGESIDLPSHAGRTYLSFLRMSDGPILAGTHDRGILRSSDDGTTWSPATAVAAPVNDIINGESGDLIAGLGTHGIARIDAAGGDARIAPTGLTGLKVLALALDSTGSVMAATDAGVWRRSGSGEWTHLGVAGRIINSIEVAPDGTIYAGITSPGALARSFDGGTTWEIIAPSTWMAFADVGVLEAFDSHVLVARGGSVGTDIGFQGSPPQIFTIQRDSTTWVKGNTQRGGSAIRGGDGTLYASFGKGSGSSGKPAGLYLSTDDGITFTHLTALPSDRTYRLLRSPDNTLYALANDSALHRSDDAGVTWAPLESNLPDITSLPTTNSRNELYLLQNGTLYRSIDKGSFWEELDDDLPTALRATAVDRDGYLYAGGNGLRVYRSSTATSGVDDEKGMLASNAATIAPNPTGAEAELRLRLEERGAVTITVVDMTGKVHTEKRMMAEAGELLERIDLSSLPSGAYTVVVEQGEKRMENRIIVVR